MSERKNFSPEFIFSETVRGWIRWHSCSLSHPDDVLGTIKKRSPKFPQLDWQFSFRPNLEPLTSFSQKGVGGFGAGLYRVTERGPMGFFCVCIAWRWQTILPANKISASIQSLLFPNIWIHSICACGYLLFSQLVVISSVRHSFTGFRVTFM